MLLTELTEELTEWLGSSPEKWTTREDVTVTSELDPHACIGNPIGVYLIPNYTGYNIQQSGARARGKQTSINDTHFITLVISTVFQDLPVDDGVANWDEAKLIIDIRERAERYLITYHHPEVQLVSVDANDLEEQALNMRNFISFTTFGYNQISCASEYELSPPSEGLRDVLR